MAKKDVVVMSVGGSIVNPVGGFDISFLKKFRALILKHVKREKKFVLVVGGGASARAYQTAAKQVVRMSDENLDWMGIAATRINAEFVRLLFDGYAYKDVISDPRTRVRTNKPIIVSAGWKPGQSSDMPAVVLAETFGAGSLMNLSNIDYVYDKDPNKYKDAKKVEQINWKDFRKDIVGNTWVPGKNTPFDPTASRRAERLGLSVAILRGTDLVNLDKAISGKTFRGTLVT